MSCKANGMLVAGVAGVAALACGAVGYWLGHRAGLGHAREAGAGSQTTTALVGDRGARVAPADMPAVGFIGLGLMGEPMARNLAKAGISLYVFNRTQSTAETLSTEFEHVEAEESAAAVVAAVPPGGIVVVMLSTGTVTRSVVDEAGFLDKVDGHTIVQMGTLSPETNLHLADQIKAAGGTYVEAPVLGSTTQAAAASLEILLGMETAPPVDDAPLLTVLEAMGRPRHVGFISQGATVKLALNQVLLSQSVSLAVSLGLVQAADIEPEIFMQILSESILACRYHTGLYARYASGDFSQVFFPARLMRKDARLIRELCEAGGVDASIVAGCEAVLEKVVDAGLGESDFSVLYSVVQ